MSQFIFVIHDITRAGNNDAMIVAKIKKKLEIGDIIILLSKNLQIAI